MPHILNLPTFSDSRGSLTVIEKIIPFDVKRIYYIYNAIGIRGGHRHKKTTQALIAISGSVNIFVNDSKNKTTFLLDSPEKGLILEPEDWHTMNNFSENCVLLVLASEHYNKNDYIDEEYK